MGDITKIAVFTAALDYSVRKGLVELRKALPDVEYTIFLHQPHKPLSTLIRNQWGNLRRNGWRWIPYQSAEILTGVLGSRPVASPTRSTPGADFTMESLLTHDNVDLVRVNDINGDDSIKLVRDLAPDLGVSLAAPILKPPLFDIPRLGSINLHKGKLPDYRGMPPAFWELWHDERSVGCSVHKVRKKLDAGELLATTTVQRETYSTLVGLQLTLDEVGIRLMCQAVKQMVSGSVVATPQPSGGKTFRKPTLKQRAQLARKLSVTESKDGLRRLVKNAVFQVYSRGYSPVARRIRGARRDQRLVILMYHRVNDELRDGVTVGIEQFDQQMRYLRRHYPLLSVREIVNGEYSTDSRRPLVAVTFDDGYADNSAFALPLMIKRGLPVTYFVTTKQAMTGAPFPHDVTQGHPLAPNSMETLRALADAGVEIGSHTRSHCDLARIDDADELFDEVVTATRELEREIGRPVRYFAIPFGMLENIHPQVFRLARDHGLAGVCTAFGGWNEIGSDPFHLQRFHGDPEIAYLKNWLTLDPRKRNPRQTAFVNQMPGAAIPSTPDTIFDHPDPLPSACMTNSEHQPI